MDALTLSMNRLGRSDQATALAAQALAVGVAANAVLKVGVTLVVGAPRYRGRAALGLSVLLVVGVAAIVVAAR
jgi:uncharacterized membrane protein (DUF4010 family)